MRWPTLLASRCSKGQSSKSRRHKSQWSKTRRSKKRRRPSPTARSHQSQPSILPLILRRHLSLSVSQKRSHQLPLNLRKTQLLFKSPPLQLTTRQVAFHLAIYPQFQSQCHLFIQNLPIQLRRQPNFAGLSPQLRLKFTSPNLVQSLPPQLLSFQVQLQRPLLATLVHSLAQSQPLLKTRPKSKRPSLPGRTRWLSRSGNP